MFLSSHVQLTPFVSLSGVRTSLPAAMFSPGKELTLCGTADTRGRRCSGLYAES